MGKKPLAILRPFHTSTPPIFYRLLSSPSFTDIRYDDIISTMKILLLYREPFDRRINSNIVSGGGEMFCKSIYENFDDVTVRHIPYSVDSQKSNDKNKEVREIINQAENIKADIIISNYPNAIYTGREISKSKIPIMAIMHNVYSMLSIIGRLNRLTHSGHSVFLVSKWQHERYKEMVKRLRNRYGDDGAFGNKNIDISGYLNSSYCKDKRKIISPKWECGTIGRCDKGKKPFLLKKLLKDSDITNLVITGKYQAEQDKKYYEKYKDYDDVEWDIPYNKVIDKLSQFGTYFSTCNKETWGITALEALSCGVPIILNGYTDGTHASQLIPAVKRHYKTIPYNDKEELKKSIKSFDKIDRKEIQEMTWEKHSLEKWKIHIEKAIDKTIDRFKNKNDKVGTLADFL